VRASVSDKVRVERRQMPTRRRAILGRALLDYIPACLVFLAILIVWQTVVTVNSIPLAILPSPLRVAQTIVTDADTLASNTGVTMVEIVLGFVSGALVGMVTGILIFYSRALERMLYPLIVASQMIPVFAIAPLLIIWFGFGMSPKIIIAAVGVFFPICVNQVEGLRSVDPGLIKLMRAYSASDWQIFRMIAFPSSIPFLVAGLQIGVTFSVIGAVIAEWIGSENGLGALMIASNSLSRTDIVFAAIVVLSVMGLIFFVGVRLMADWLWPWQKKPSRRRGSL